VLVGADTGGTFTDLVDDDGRVHKVLSTPDDPARAIGEGIATLGESPSLLAHGTTVATNALLERRGARVALIATEGFADVIEIARQVRPSLYDQFANRPEPLVPRDLRFEFAGSAPELPGGIDAVAVCLLNADLAPDEEQAVAAAYRDMDVTCSHEVSPEFREYERTVTTVVNAYLRPTCGPYLRALARVAGEVVVLTSAGGLLTVEEAASLPAALLLSGPAGGVQAGAAAAVAAGFPDAVTFDMGGTSTDVGLVLDGRPEPAAQRTVAGFPIRMPSLDVHTIGAGGGSIASIDAGGALVVGPRSAGAVPGPACYGRGGIEPTVTDADLLLGRIPVDASFSSLGSLSVDAARDVFQRAGIDAPGVVAVVDAAMEQAVRVMTSARGIDPRNMALVAFGGAGPLHACAVAESLGMAAVVVPPRAGVLSAVGLLCAPRQRDLVRSWPAPSDHDGAAAAARELAAHAERLVSGGEVAVALDCRYAGQSHELTVPTIDDFHDEHRRRNGFARDDAPVEVVALRATVRGAPAMSYDDFPQHALRTGRIAGPHVVSEPDCTIWVPDGWEGEVGGGGSWILRRSRS
jgi:N-methylhydantoinase A/oxoprolinase/acetone carboxylase beta subunit